MSSVLIITSVEKLQNEINKAVKSFSGTPGIYVSLNKTQKGVADLLNKSGIDLSKLFFIDCVSAKKESDEVLYISPNDLKELSSSIDDFAKEIDGKKFLIIDALSTLLIYNSENNVAAFIKNVTEFASRHGINVIAFSPLTKGEDLLNKIFNFFDEVKKDEQKEVKREGDEELIY